MRIEKRALTQWKVTEGFLEEVNQRAGKDIC